MFAHSAGSHTHAGLNLEVKEPVVHLRVVRGAHAGPKGGSVDDLHIIFPLERLGWLPSARQLYVRWM